MDLFALGVVILYLVEFSWPDGLYNALAIRLSNLMPS